MHFLSMYLKPSAPSVMLKRLGRILTFTDVPGLTETPRNCTRELSLGSVTWMSAPSPSTLMSPLSKVSKSTIISIPFPTPLLLEKPSFEMLTPMQKVVPADFSTLTLLDALNGFSGRILPRILEESNIMMRFCPFEMANTHARSRSGQSCVAYPKVAFI